MGFEQGYNITEVDSWPYEKYRISPITPNMFSIGDQYDYFYNSYYYYLNNPTVQIDEIFRDFESYNNITQETKQDGKTLSWRSTNSYVETNLFNSRVNEYGPFSHFYKMIGNNNNTVYSLAYFPKKLFLRPISATKITNGGNTSFILTLSSIILDSYVEYFNAPIPTAGLYAPKAHLSYTTSPRETLYINNQLTNKITLFYSICSSQTIIKTPITVSNYTNIILETDLTYKKLRKDFFYLNAIFNYWNRDKDNQSIIYFEQLNYVYIDDPLSVDPYTSNFILYYDTNLNKNLQTFSYVQSAISASIDPQSSVCSMLSAVVYLDSANVKYYQKSTRVGTNTVSVVSATDNKINLSYICDSDTLKFSKEKVIDTVNNYYVHGIPTFTKNDIGKGIVPQVQSKNDTITFVTKYPPYYYTYGVYLTSTTLPNPTENTNLNFNLSTIPITDTTADYFSAITYMYSDFNFLQLDLNTYTIGNEYIIYETEFTDTNLLNDIKVYYKQNGNRVLYDLANPTWVNAKNASVLEITNPKTFIGNPILTLRPKLSTLSGFKHAIKNSKIILTGKFDAPTYDLVVNTIKEGNDYIDISAESMVTEEEAPGIDLRNSNIKWTVTPYDSNVKINYLLKDSNENYNPVNFITNNTLIPYNTNSWAVRVSGYGGNEKNITLFSQKQNKSSTIKNDLFFYDAFINKSLILDPKIPLNNLNQIKTITLITLLPYKDRTYNLPSTNNIYWDWTYNNTYNNTTPITAYYENGNVYERGETGPTQTLSCLSFKIQPDSSINQFINDIKIKVYTADTPELVFGSYDLPVVNFPSSSIINANFKIVHNTQQSETILDTFLNENVLTRSASQNTNFLLIPNILSNISYTSYQWSILQPNGTTVTNTTNYDYNYNFTQTGKYTVTFTLKGAKTNTWSILHDIQKTITIYKISDSEFNKQLKFISYPQYAWKNSDQISILTPSNFSTIAAGTTAYNYKKSNTEVFYVSANGNFDRYVYQQGSDRELLLDTANDGVNILTLKYTDEFLSSVGTKLYLSAFNEYFPSNTPLYYKTIYNGTLVTSSYNIVAESIPYSISTPSNLLFTQNPKIVDYNGITHTFSAIISSFDLDVNRSVFIQQKFNTNPLNTPAKIQSGESTITYILSAPKWIVKKEIPAVDGIYNVFTIRPGDDLSPLRVKNTTFNTLYLNASSNLNIKIPETTFNTIKQSNPDFDSGDFWNTKNITIPQRANWQTLQAYATSTKPEIFLNTAYTLSGNQVFLEFNTPEYTKNPIVSYAVNFGEGVIQEKPKNERFYNTYTTLGTFYITYSAIYNDNSKKVFTEKTPFIVKKNWDEYNKESIRIISEANLELPYSLNDISIQPNEFGDADIFNTCLSRIDDNLNYLKNNIQTINSNAPSYYYGWMGSNQDNRSDGIRWYTPSYGSEFYETPNYAASEGTSYFTDIKDIHIGKYIYVLDDKRFRLFEKDKNCKEIKFLKASDMDDLFFNPQSITVNEDETSIYVADSIRHKIYRFDFDFSDLQNPLFGLVLTVGTLGGLNDNSKFDFPSEIFLWNDNLFVLDYNNNCIKQYSGSLSWIHTYYDDVLKDDQIVNFTVHESGLIYAVTKNLKVHIFDELAKSVYSTFDVAQIGESEIVKMEFDENGEFLYITTTGNVFKYSSVGEFLTTFNLPNINGLKFTSCKHYSNRELYVSTNKSILKFQDFVDLFKIGDGLDSKYWSLDQILLKKEEFATDINYNLALNRTAQNLKTFRNSLNGKFVLVSEQTARGTATYFSLIPILKEDNVKFGSDVENEKLKIGVNEFYIPDVVNRELKKLHDSQISLRENLDVSFSDSSSSNLDGEKSKCGGDFCWSWRAMSCYDLSLPLIRLCNINPITYAELMNTFQVNYAPTKIWEGATSNCCNEYTSPLT
jgi:hypothetical protein